MYPADLASEDQCCNKSNSNGHAWLYGRPEDISHGHFAHTGKETSARHVSPSDHKASAGTTAERRSGTAFYGKTQTKFPKISPRETRSTGNQSLVSLSDAFSCIAPAQQP